MKGTTNIVCLPDQSTGTSGETVTVGAYLVTPEGEGRFKTMRPEQEKTTGLTPEGRRVYPAVARSLTEAVARSPKHYVQKMLTDVKTLLTLRYTAHGA